MLAPMLYVSGVLSGLGYASARLGQWQIAGAEFALASLCFSPVLGVVLMRRSRG